MSAEDRTVTIRLECAGQERTEPSVRTPAGRACWYPDTAILTQEEVPEVLALSLRTVVRLPIRCASVSPGRRRWLFRDVIAYLEARMT